MSPARQALASSGRALLVLGDLLLQTIQKKKARLSSLSIGEAEGAGGESGKYGVGSSQLRERYKLMLHGNSICSCPTDFFSVYKVIQW